MTAMKEGERERKREREKERDFSFFPFYSIQASILWMVPSTFREGLPP
jgi:hypothetical protein